MWAKMNYEQMQTVLLDVFGVTNVSLKSIKIDSVELDMVCTNIDSRAELIQYIEDMEHIRGGASNIEILGVEGDKVVKINLKGTRG